MILWGFEAKLYEQVIFFLLLTFLFAIPYFIACLLMHSFSLKSDEDKKKFYSLSEVERGRLIGEELSGWW